MYRTGTLALIISLSLPTAAWGACEQPLTRASMLLEIEQATQAFRQLDRDGFTSGRDGLIAALPCLSEPLQPADAASLHGLMAMSAFLAKDDGASVANLHAAVRSQPDYDLPRDLFPDGHPLRLHLHVARSLTPGLQRALPVPAQGLITVDGSSATHAPGDRPSVLQWTAQEIEVLDTAYLEVGAPMPDWGPVPVVATGTTDRRPWGLLAGAAGSAAAAAGLYSLAASRHSLFLDHGTPYGDLPALQQQANAFTVASAGAGAVALGLGTAVVLRW